jgi:tRNA:m4X modification enzyme
MFQCTVNNPAHNPCFVYSHFFTQKAKLNMAETDEQQGPPPLPEGWTRCCAYLEKKRRFCRQQQRGISKYCGNHSQLSEEEPRLRIPCPIDPSHQIYKDQVDKHVKVCPKVVKMKEQEQLPYFCRDVNTGGHGVLGDSTCTQSLEWAQRIAIKVLEVHQRHFGIKSKPPESLTEKDIHEAIALKDLSQPELDAGLADAVQHFRIKSGGPRHIHQQASLVGHLRHAGVLPATPDLSTCTNEIEFLEMGAGRGMLGLVAAGAASACGSHQVRLTLVERAGSRSKADTVLRAAAEPKDEGARYMKLKTVQWSRVQCDLAHIDITNILETPNEPTVGEKRKVSEESGKQLVVIAKHLCGAGTDLALKALRAASKVDVCVLATCCHGVCEWNHYVGRNFLATQFGDGFGAEEFELLRKWSTGTVAVTANDVEKDNEHQPASETEDDSRDPFGVTAIVESLKLNCGIQGLGRACQRLIDAGRCDYMENTLFASGTHNVELHHYVDASVTPQNAVIVARKKS